MFGSGINPETRHADLSGDGRGVDDCAAVFEDGRDFVLHAEEDPEHIDIKRLAIILLSLFLCCEASRAFDARIVKGEIQPPKRGQRLVHKALHISFAADVRRSEEHTSELQSPYDLVCRL